MNNPIIFFLAIIGALSLGKIIYDVLLKWIQNEKKDPWLNRLDQDTLDQIKLEKRGNYVGWKDGEPVVLNKKSNNQKGKIRL